MLAAICTKYGPPEVLVLREVSKPIPKPNELLVKVMATPVNSADVRIRALAVSGPLKVAMRVMLGFTRPRKQVLGSVFSGIIEQLGNDVTSFYVGDHVYGTTGLQFGTYAEYVTVPENGVVTRKPSRLTFEQAAAIPFGGLTAIYFLRKYNLAHLHLSNVLIYGATGSVGTAAVQLAKKYGAKVTAVCSKRGKELALDLGADHIVLYEEEELRTLERFDLIFDAVGKTVRKQFSRNLNKHGQYITVGGLDAATDRKEDLQLLDDLIETGELKAVQDKIYDFNEIIEAHRYVDTGRKKGNVVIKIHNE
jgi:NADPH:quinone reductase-like Zn-dependent oxidoreductase